MKLQLKKQPANQQTKKSNTHVETATTFYDHVVELRRRGLWIGLFLIVSSAVAYSYHDVLLKVIMAPLNGEKLVYLTPGGGFSFIFLISLYAGLLAAIPVLIYHLHAFIKPALPVRAQRSATRVLLASTVLVAGGVLYGYFIAIPAALQFLMTFAGDTVSPNLTADSYLNFFLAYIAGLALLSLLPLILMFIHWIKPLKPSGLLKSERVVILFAFIAAAIITPTPDIVNQAMIAVPVIAIYQLGVIAVMVAIVKEKRAKKSSMKAASIIDIPVPEAVISSFDTPKSVTQAQVAVESTPIQAPQPQRKEVQSTKPARTARSIDGFHKPQQGNLTSRQVMTTRERVIAYPTRPSMDGMVTRRTQITQN